jgi:hypothetical protein
MRLEGELIAKMGIERLWGYIENPEEFAKCVPGMKEYIIEGEDIKAKVKAGIGFIRTTFNVKLKMLEKDRENRTIKMNISGSGAGNRFEGDINVKMEPISDEETKVNWWSEAKVSGLLATVSSSMIKGVLEKTFNQAFECLSKK